MKSTAKWGLLGVLLAFIGLALQNTGCTNSTAAPAPVTITQVQLETATFSPTGSPTYTLTITPTSTITYTPTSTYTPVTIIITPTSTSTPTPYPTPSAGVSWSTSGCLGVGISGSQVWVGGFATGVDVYTLGGTYVTTVGTGAYMTGIVPDGSGGIYAASSCNSAVKHIDNTYTLVGSFPTAYCSSGLAVDASGNFYVTDGNSLVQEYSSSGVSITSWTVSGGKPFGIAIAGSPQTIYVASQTNKAVYTYDLNGNPLSTKWLINGDGTSLAVDGLGRLYAGDASAASPMQRFDLKGNFQIQWGSFYSQGMAIDASNNIYIGNLGVMQVFTP